MARKPIETVRIEIAKRNDRFYISSVDIPGLWLWGKDLKELFEDLSPSIQYLYKQNRGLDVVVREKPTSRLLRLLLTFLFHSQSRSDKFEIYPRGSQKLTQAHG